MRTKMSNPIFIIATGQRCGSTLLQRFLNSHHDILIWGEHNGLLIDIFRVFDKWHSWETEFCHHLALFLDNGVNNFIANMTPQSQDLDFALVQLMENLWKAPANNLGKTVWGFKEVRYDYEICLHLRTFFPSMKVIYLTRNILDCFISLQHWERHSGGWERQDTIQFINNWIRINKSFIPVVGKNREWIFPVHYEMLVNDHITVTKNLVSWLGLEIEMFDLNVFSHKIYTERYRGKDKRPKIRKEDLTPEEIALLNTPQIVELHKQLQLEYSLLGV